MCVVLHLEAFVKELGKQTAWLDVFERRDVGGHAV